jgi:hypothetical protein
MNSSLWSADRMTHIKIIATSLVMTAVVIVAVGSILRTSASNPDGARNYVERAPIVAGKPVTLSVTTSSTIR